jgi:type VI protein secretion system component Hcp
MTQISSEYTLQNYEGDIKAKSYDDNVSKNKVF